MINFHFVNLVWKAKRPFNAKGRRAQELLELIHSDVYGPMLIQARGGYEYFITFIDDYSRFGYVYLMKRKSEIGRASCRERV